MQRVRSKSDDSYAQLRSFSECEFAKNSKLTALKFPWEAPPLIFCSFNDCESAETDTHKYISINYLNVIVSLSRDNLMQLPTKDYNDSSLERLTRNGFVSRAGDEVHAANTTMYSALRLPLLPHSQY